MPNDLLDAQFGSTDARYELLDRAQRQLEAAWKTGTEVDLVQLVPPVGHPWHEWVLVRLISVDRDCRWEKDRPKTLKEYLDDWPILRGRSDLLKEVFSNDETEIVRKPFSMLTIGRRFGRYEIRERLGQGAMGTVYLAWDDRLRRNVALKIPHDVDDPCVRRRFLRESHIVAAVDHPNMAATRFPRQLERG